MPPVCIQIQLTEGGSNHLKYDSTAFVTFATNPNRVQFDGIGSEFDNSTVLEAMVACSNSGYIEGTYVPITGGTEKTVRAPLTQLNLQCTRAIKINDLLVIALPVEPKCIFEQNEMKERAALASAAINCAMAAANRIDPHARPAIALQMAAMDVEELVASCAEANISAQITLKNNTDELTNFVFATYDNNLPENVDVIGSTISFLMPSAHMTDPHKQLKQQLTTTATKTTFVLIAIAICVALTTYAIVITD
tara:strand:- start:340 stop:1092 length:753 start_codon:yes stop_codon:yes gene_type:complete